MKNEAWLYGVTFTTIDLILFYVEELLHRLFLRGYALGPAFVGALNDTAARVIVLQPVVQIVYLVFLWRITNKLNRAIATTLCLYVLTDLFFYTS